MQTGAFVQLIILFVAISSRMSVLSSELEEALQLGVSTCNRLLVIIHVSMSSACKHGLTKSQPMSAHATTSHQLPSHPLTSCPPHTDYDVPSEDTGQTVARCEPIDTSTIVIKDLGTKSEAMSEVQVTPPPSYPTNDTEADMSNYFLLTDFGVGGDHITAQVKRVTTKVAQKPRKTKKKLDEIDEIFAFS